MSNECETFNAAMLLFYLHSRVHIDIMSL